MARRTPQQNPAVLATITFMTPPGNADPLGQTISILIRLEDEERDLSPRFRGQGKKSEALLKDCFLLEALYSLDYMPSGALGWPRLGPLPLGRMAWNALELGLF